MNCPRCGVESHTRMGEKDPEKGWMLLYYCENCQETFGNRGGRICPTCGISYQEFLNTGLLGCPECYRTFAPELDRGIEKHSGHLPGTLSENPLWPTPRSREERKDPAPVEKDLRLAESRTHEIQDLLREGDRQNPEEPLPEKRWDSESGEIAGERVSTPAFPVRGVLGSIRIRVARNLEGILFWNRLRSDQQIRLSRALLSEKSILPSLFPDSVPGRRLYTGDEDHLRMEWTFPFENHRHFLETTEKVLEELDRLNRAYRWARDPDYGYLAASPGNCGTGLRISFFLHVPALYGSLEWGEWIRALKEAGLEVRGPEGEGSLPGPSVQISNRSGFLVDPFSVILGRLLALIERLVVRELDLADSSRSGS